MRTKYNRNFYNTYSNESISSAREIISILSDYYLPQSVIDVGCGIGTWLFVWKENGINDILGIDGQYVDKSQLLINKNKFVTLDLADKNLNFNYSTNKKKYDLAMSLEVAEHIPENCSNSFVKFLCSLSDVILFSAAIPFQGGKLHINEKWPEYWAKKFNENGYLCDDLLRSYLWNNKNCAYYYAQNIFLFIKKEKLKKIPKLIKTTQNTDINCLSRVHPDKWVEKNTEVLPLEKLIKQFPKSLFNFFIRLNNKIKNLKA